MTGRTDFLRKDLYMYLHVCMHAREHIHTQYILIIIIFLSSIRSIKTCYGCYKTESFPQYILKIHIHMAAVANKTAD
jgi:hypothetical protein